MTVHLNERLLEKQGIDEEGAKRILALHEERENMFDLMEMLDPTDPQQIISLREWAVKVEELEFRLQDAWGFEQNRNMHSWWYRVPHCKCPKMDNMDYMGTDLRIHTADCPIHGKDTWEDNS